MDPDLDTDRNESTNVPISKLRIETKPKRFYVFQNLKWNVSILFQKFWNKTKTFFSNLRTFIRIHWYTVPPTKPKVFDVFQLLFCKSKTLLYNTKNFRSERERFGSIMNFVSETNIFDFFGGRYSGKTKANNL